MEENMKRLAKCAIVTTVALGLIIGFGIGSTAVAKVYTIKYAQASAPDSFHGYCAEQFKKYAEKMGKGQIKVELFHGGQMGSEQDNVQQVSQNMIQLSTMAVNNVTPFAPIVGFCTLPYIWTTKDEAYAVLDGPVGDKLNTTMVKQGNFRALGWLVGGFRVLTNSKKPIRTPADLKGVTIRVPKNPIMIGAYKAWGINPVPMAWTETFNALQQKVVDGQDNPYIVNETSKFQEVQKYITNIHYILWIGPLLASETWYSTLPDDIRKVVDEAAKKAVTDERRFVENQEAAALLKMINAGMELQQPANNEKEWIEKAQAIWPQFYEEIGGKAFVDEVVNFLGNYRKGKR
jgi:tripartite ATP-independent transporter DctP family solute receptor